MIYTAVSSTVDGSVVFQIDADVSAADKQLGSLKKTIDKLEQELESKKSKETFLEGDLIEANKAVEQTTKRVNQLKADLEGIRNIIDPQKSAFGKVDPDTYINALSREKEVTKELEEQKKLLSAQEKQLKKVGTEYESLGVDISQITTKVDLLKDQAGELQRKIDNGNASLKKFADSVKVSDKRIVNLRQEMAQLEQEQAILKKLGLGLGDERYDQNAARIAEISRELKEYKKSLTEVAAAEQAAGQARQQAGQTAGSQSRINTYLEKTSSLYQKLNGMISKTSELSGVLKNVAASTGGKLSGAFQSAGTALGGFSAKLAGLLSKAGPYAAIIVAAIQKIVKAVKQVIAIFVQFAKAAIKILTNVGKYAGKLAFILGQMGKIAFSVVKKALSFAKDLNVFSKLSEELAQKFKRLGSAIKSALVFSVIYQGLSMMRQQIGAYLSVNTQFMTALRRLQGALLTAFQPIYEIVVPALTTFINVLTRAVAAVAQFFAALFGKTAKQAQSNAENLYDQANATQAAGDAAEEASKQLAAFDEINKLDGKNSAGGGGSAGAETGPLFDFEYEETPFDSWGEAFSAFLDKLLGGMRHQQHIQAEEEPRQRFQADLESRPQQPAEFLPINFIHKAVDHFRQTMAEVHPVVFVDKRGKKIQSKIQPRAQGAPQLLPLDQISEVVEGVRQIPAQLLHLFQNARKGEHFIEILGQAIQPVRKIFERVPQLRNAAQETLAGFLLGLDMLLMAQAASDIVIGFFDEMTNTIRRIPWGDIGRQIADFLVNLDWRGMLSSVTSAIAAGIMAAVAGIRGFLDRIVPELDRIAGEIVQTLIEFFRDKVKWDELARTIGDGIAAALQFISDLFDPELFYEIGKAIGDFFINLQWVEIFGGLTEALANGINSAIAALRGFLDSVTPEKLKEVADGIAQKINEFVNKVEWAELGRTINDGIIAALDFMIELMDQIDWDAIGRAIAEFLENIEWETIFEKLGTLMGQVISAKLKVVDLSGALNIGMEIIAGIAKGILEELKGYGGVLGFLKALLVLPLLGGIKSLLGIHSPSTVFAEIGGFLIAGLAKGISDTWHTITDFFSEKISSLKQVLMDAWENIKFTASSKWSEIKAALGAKWDEIKSSASETFKKVRQKIVDAWNNVKNDAIEKWDEIKAGIADAWEKVKTAAGEKFGEIKDKIINTMDEVKDKDWFKTGKTIVDGILSGLESIWNSLTSWARSVKDTISDALSGASGSRGGGFGTGTRGGGGFNARIAAASIPDITAFNIPALAAGAVIPPNREFLAVLGDQRSGNNIETPEGLLRDIFRQENGAILAVLREILSAIRQGKEMTVDGNTFAKLVYNGYNSESNRKGVNLVEVHA